MKIHFIFAMQEKIKQWQTKLKEKFTNYFGPVIDVVFQEVEELPKHL